MWFASVLFLFVTRFHVRNKDNIARVRRDEAQAREEEEERQRRVSLAEQESRMQVLRDRATRSQAVASREEQTDALERTQPQPTGHINFFAETEAGVKSASVKNKEHEAEKRQEQEKLEKNIGILTYLGQSSAEMVGKSWYDKSQNERQRDDALKARKSEKFKRAQDPLHRMNDYLRKKEERRRRKEDKEGKSSKRHEHRHRRHAAAAASSGTLDSAAKHQQLRQERLLREQRERQRAESVFARARGEETRDTSTDLIAGPYSSQFNPHLARQNRSRYS